MICLLVVGFSASQWRAAKIAAEIEAAKPRIESCEFRAPNARQVFEGARVVLTTRASWPEKSHAQPILIFTDKHGRQFHSAKGSWGGYGGSGGTYGFQEKGREIHEAHLTFDKPPHHLKDLEQRLYTGEGLILVKRKFPLSAPNLQKPILALHRTTKGQVQSLEFNPQPQAIRANFELKYRLSHPEFQPEKTAHYSVIRFDAPAFRDDNLISIGSSSSTSDSTKGEAAFSQSFVWPGTHAWPKKSHFRVLLSIRDEWPLLVTFQLPSKRPTKTTNIPFTAKLAPLDLAKR